VCGGCAEVVPRDADEPTQALVARIEQRRDRSGARIQLFDRGHGVQLVQIERVETEQLE
jgi:hypothetical protein